jgi:hypothetical protein
MTRNLSWVRRCALLAAPATMLLLALTGVPETRTARGDELKLKDGSTISGTIVGFEEKSFRVKTSYGFAVVQKDQVVSISMTEAAKPPAEKKPDAVEGSTPAPPGAIPAGASAPSGPAPVRKATARQAPSTAAPPIAIAVPAQSAPDDSGPGKIAPVKPAAPETIREEVTGNLYTNDTYHFRMYKPPSWDVIVAERALLPGAIAAMGTSDETTYLLIGQETTGKSPATEMGLTEHRLRDIMDNFRPLDDRPISVSGIAVTERHFRGTVDEHEWSGVVVVIPRGARLYTIFGMTRADTDLVQIQENVIARTIASFQFADQ